MEGYKAVGNGMVVAGAWLSVGQQVLSSCVAEGGVSGEQVYCIDV